MRIAKRLSRLDDLEDDLNYTDDPFRIAVIIEEIDMLSSKSTFAYLGKKRKIR